MCCMIWAAVREVKDDSAAGLSCLTVKLCKVAQAVFCTGVAFQAGTSLATKLSLGK